MLDVLNRYAHGFVVVPVLLASRRGGLFTLLETASCNADELAERLGANSGHLQVALRVFESLGWIGRLADGRYQATPALAKQRLVPDGLWSLLDRDMEAYLRVGTGGVIAPWIEKVEARWNVDDPLLADFCDSLLVVPVLALLTKRGILKALPAEGFAALPEGVREEVVALFERLGWLESQAGRYTLTPPGEFMFERAMNLGVVASYRPMLLAMDELLFGDAERIFALAPDGAESHVDRSMNVIASGFMHDRYFAEVEGILVSIFSREPFSAQPRYVADMGCGDGTFLKRVYETVRDKTPRGKRLDDYPLTMIGIDLNQASLDETSLTLSGIEHTVVAGDIGKPKQVAERLEAAGVALDSVLHIRSFLDHDRPYLAPADEASLEARSGARYLGAYVDRQGRAIAPAVAVQSLVEHLQRWAEVITEHGLILLEVHCQDPLVVREYIDQSESLYFDAISGFSHQLLIEADAALMAAAEAGLFPRREYFRKFPGFLPYCRITLNLFERRPYRVRLARPDDLPALLRLEDACWPAPMRAAADELLRRMEAYALGQWVLEMDGEVIGVIYSQRIESVDVLRACTLRDVPRLRSDTGSVVQLLAVNVLPEKQHLGLGDELLHLMLMRSALQGGVQRVAGVTRCKNFSGRSLADLDEYLTKRDASGRPIDPILQFHHSHGAKFLGAVPGYRPEDTDNLGAGVLLCYDFSAPGAQRESADPLVVDQAAAPAAGTRSRLEACLRSLLGPSRQAAFSWERPLREMKLDSLDLLEFRTLLQRTFERPLSPTFFFSHPTLADAYRYFDARAGAVPVGEPARPVLSPGPEPQAIRVEHTRAGPGERVPIAVVGMACRYPGGENLDEYWNLLLQGRDAIDEIPSSRWNVDEFYSANPEASGKIVSRYGGFIRHPDEFDASFFNISPREAAQLDPQQRLLLELHWEALENAGMDPRRLREAACGIFVGLYSHDYETLHILNGDDADLDIYYATGNSPSIAAGRLAYFLGTRGPAITLDTACSSSLVAIHQAMRSLRSGESDIAMASGVNLILSPRLSIAFSKAGMLSPRGRCRTFDAGADGYVRSDGCGVVVLKRLDDAQRDGDVVLAVLCGSAVNQDGASNGLTAPSLPAQEQLLRTALKDAALAPSDIDYIEAHGTGTSLGDPVEFHALRNVFGSDPNRTDPLWLGSVKTNIGHTEAAAGIAGLIKVVLAMREQMLPTHLHFDAPNPHIDLDSVPARIPVQSLEWRNPHRPLRAGVSSFGFSGTNAHVIVEQAATDVVAKPASTTTPDRSVHVLALSAKNVPALEALIARYHGWLRDHPEVDLGDVCHTANAGRAHHEYRLAFSAGTREELVHALEQGRGRASTLTRVKGAPKVAFLFTGQGSQYIGMARELSLVEPVFRDALAECREILAGELAHPLEQILYPDAEQPPSVLDETENTQPALFAVEYALARMLRSWGVEPAAVMGHSVGEYVAACIAGVFSLEDGLKLIASRGRLMGALPRDGAMLAVLGPAGVVIEALERAGADAVAIAAYNGPENIVISGRRDVVERLGREFEAAGVRVVPLHVSHAFHSPLMEAVLPEFTEIARQVRFSRPEIELISNLTGAPVLDEITMPDYWARHIREPVRFEQGVGALVKSGVDVMLEIGPHPVLSAMGQACTQAIESSSIDWLYTLVRGASDSQGIVASLGTLYERGVDIDWGAFDAAHARRRVSLPNYPWQRKRHWFETSGGNRSRSSGRSAAADDWFYELRWDLKAWDEVDGQRISATGAEAPGQWIIFADRSGVADELGRQLRERGDQAVLVRPGDIFDERHTGALTIDPASPDDYRRVLVRAAGASDRPIRGIVHLWGLDTEPGDTLTIADLESAQRTGSGSVLLMLQSLAAQTWSEPPKFWVVTRGVQPVDSESSVSGLAQAPLWGLGRVAALEHPDCWGGLIDLASGDDAATASRRLISELYASDIEDQIALRERGRYVPRLVRAARDETRTVRFDPAGCYLITGGLGRLGMTLARWMIERGARTLVLVGRTGIPDQSSWERLDQASPAFPKVAEIRALSDLGARIVPVAASVADAEAMSALFMRFGGDLPELKGVIHAAGLIEMETLARLDLSALNRVLEPKVTGTWLLHELSRSFDLDFFAMFSSAASVWGARELGHYAAANHFLDAIAHYRQAKGLPAVTVNWGWWEGGGSSKHADELFEQFGVRPMPAAAALDGFAAILASGCVQATIAAVDWPVFKPIYEIRRSRPLIAELRIADADLTTQTFDDQGAESDLIARLRSAEPDEARQLLQDHIRTLVAGILRSDPQDLGDDAQGFFKLGMDSLMSVQLRRRLEQTLELKLPTTVAFQYPTVRLLSGFIADELGIGSGTAIDRKARNSIVQASVDGLSGLDGLEEADLAAILDDEIARLADDGESDRGYAS